MIKEFKTVLMVCGLLLISLASCQDKSTALVRSWKLKDMHLTRQVPDLLKPTIDKAIDDMKKSNYVITYNPDGTYTTQMNNHVLKGKWKLNFNSSKISVETDNGQSKDYSIIKLTTSEYSFKTNENGQDVVFEMIPAN